MQYHKYSLTEIENMMPWERDIYVILLQQHLEEEETETKTTKWHDVIYEKLTSSNLVKKRASKLSDEQNKFALKSITIL